MTQPAPVRRVQCKQCLAVADMPADADPHARTWCGCCTLTGDDGQPHHHGRDVRPAEECSAANHPGKPCWNPPAQPDRPDGCTICRPVLHLPVAGQRQVP